MAPAKSEAVYPATADLPEPKALLERANEGEMDSMVSSTSTTSDFIVRV
jgi:hypothetical protein